MLKLDVGIMGNQGKPLGRPIRRIVRSLAHFANILDSREIAPSLKEEIMKIASSYPEGALDNIYINLDHFIQKCAIKGRKDMPKEIDQPEPEVVAPKPEKVVQPKPQVQRKALFEDGEIPQKWTTAPAAQITQPKPPPIPQIKEEKPKKITPEEAIARFKMMAELNPPREGNRRKQEEE